MAKRSIRVLLLVVAAFAAISTESVQADQASSPSVPAEKLPASTLIYVSDYFSFVGTDSQGRVAFALDNNRGRDGEKYQAEHFVVLHDERKGWVDLLGNGRYENTKKELARIPDSPFFQFENTPETGLTITSAKNQLTLRIEFLKQRMLRTHGKSTIWYGSAPAVLTWQGRTISGQVIYESLVMPDFNRLTRTYWGMWKEFQGLYLLADGSNDIYLHSQQSERMAAVAGKLVGFSVFNELPESLNDLRVEILDREFAPGFYRWPTAWRITWTGSKGPASMTLSLSYQKKIANWVIGGFSMGIVSGDLSYDGRTWPIYGLAELIM
ncbi:MAG: hypothetical protein ACREI2_11400 [Nitrospiraceae bacterium]